MTFYLINSGTGGHGGAGGGGGGGGPSVAYTNFASRAGASFTGADSTNYQNLLDGLTTDGFFNSVTGSSSLLDFLYIFAASSSTLAILNLVSASYTASTHGATLDFSANHGFKGANGTADSAVGDYVRTFFNPVTAATPNFATNSAHLSVWSVTSTAAPNADMGSKDGATPGDLNLYAKFDGDGNMYSRVNDSGAGGLSVTSALGHFLGSRVTSNFVNHYVNGASNGSVAKQSDSIGNAEVVFLRPAISSGGNTIRRLAAGTIGAGLTSTQAFNLFTRLSNYMSSVGA